MQDYRTLEIKELIWNEWNITHIAPHKLTPSDVEAACTGDHIATDTYSNRILMIGVTQTEEVITVVLDPEGEGRYFPVTARPASRKERQLFINATQKEAA